MGGSLIQLVAQGVEDIYLTKDPQITYFKVVYRRHTNFSREHKQLYFSQDPDFGKRVTCVISQDGDLVDGIAVVIKLPKVKSLSGNDGINMSVDSNGMSLFKHNTFAWVRRLGYVIIKKVEIEINGRIIDRHFGEWMHIWNELTGPRNRGHDKNIGDVPELFNFTESKNEYTIMVPMSFWFCRNPGLALPLIALQYSDVKLNIEFNTVDKCYSVSPTHYIECTSDIANFKKFEYIEQNIDNTKRAGLFVHYDILNKRLYYVKLTQAKLVGVEYDGNISSLTQNEINTILSSNTSRKYTIIGTDSRFTTMPNLGITSKSNYIPSFDYLSISESYIIVDYIYIDADERAKFARSTHDYLIEQVQFTPSSRIEGTSHKIKVSANQPCKLMVWVVQSDDVASSNDTFNYTNSHERKRFDIGSNVTLTDMVGKSMIESETILLNGVERITLRPSEYFRYCQTHQHFKFEPSEGINMFAFGLFPTALQPSASCNMSQIETVEILLKMTPDVNLLAPAHGRTYCVVNNIARISTGLFGLLFV